jgi:hypothetical protein
MSPVSREALDSLLTELAEDAGLDTLSLDDDGTCILRLDQVPVQLDYWSDEDQLCLFAPLGDLPEFGQSVMAQLLDANVLFSGTRKSTLGVAAGTRLVTLQRLVPVAGLDLPGFQQVLEDFVAAAEHWQRWLASAAADASGGEAAPSGRSAEPPPSMLV